MKRGIRHRYERKKFFSTMKSAGRERNARTQTYTPQMHLVPLYIFEGTMLFKTSRACPGGASWRCNMELAEVEAGEGARTRGEVSTYTVTVCVLCSLCTGTGVWVFYWQCACKSYLNIMFTCAGARSFLPPATNAASDRARMAVCCRKKKKRWIFNLRVFIKE